MNLIQQLLPEVHFIHVIRDGRDVAISNKGLWFGPDSVEETARRWQSWIEEARSQSRKLKSYVEVRYEDLVCSTEPVLKKLCHFIRLRWDPIMLDYYQIAENRMSEIARDAPAPGGKGIVCGEDRTAIHSLTSAPPQRDRIGRWKSEMTCADRKRFEEIAGEMLRELGYDID